MLESDFKTSVKTRLCIPVLSVLDLLVLSIYIKKRETILYYDNLPRYLRGISRLLRIPKEMIVIVLSAVTRLNIEKIKHGDDVPDYPHLHLQAMETVTTISDQIMPELTASPSNRCLKKLLGEKPSLAYSAKCLSQYQLFPYLLPTVVCYKNIGSPENYVVAWNSEWPDKWNQLISRNLDWINFEFFSWPVWYVFIRSFLIRISLLFGLLIIAAVFVLRRGITFKTPSKKYFKIITEFIDPGRLNSNTYDADYWIDNKKITKKDILFFLTNQQRKILKSSGHAKADIVELFKNKGYELAILDDLPYSAMTFRHLFALYLQFSINTFSIDFTTFSKIFFKAFCEYMEFLPLFLYYSSKNLIYLTFPNGLSGIRFDDAVVTGLCRKFGIRSVGCQTRTIYTKKFEDCFDCYDIYLSWGTSWEKITEERTLFIDRVSTVGCIYLDHLLPLYKKYPHQHTGHKQNKNLSVSIFSADISDNHHYTKKYAKSFLINCIKLAAEFPDLQFKVKTKDPEHIDLLMSDKEFYKEYSAVKDNFSFVNHLRYDYSEILFSSDIVIAIGFTTPGSEALLLGKRAIYYTELNCGGQPFKHIPFFIADSEHTLKTLFNDAVRSNGRYTGNNFESIKGLDMFRDGQARQRIYKHLLEETQ